VHKLYRFLFYATGYQLHSENGQFPLQTAVSDWSGNSNKQSNVLIAPHAYTFGDNEPNYSCLCIL